MCGDSTDLGIDNDVSTVATLLCSTIHFYCGCYFDTDVRANAQGNMTFCVSVLMECTTRVY